MLLLRSVVSGLSASVLLAGLYLAERACRHWQVPDVGGSVAIDHCCAATPATPLVLAEPAHHSLPPRNVTILWKQLPEERRPKTTKIPLGKKSISVLDERSVEPASSKPPRTAVAAQLPQNLVAVDPAGEPPPEVDDPFPMILPASSSSAEPLQDITSTMPEQPGTAPGELGVASDAMQGEIDGRTVRSAIASTALGAVAGRMRPSQLLGDAGSGTLLANTLDGFWGLGQQAALRLIVEGKAPDSREITNGAYQVVAAAANQQVSSLIDDATQFGQDNGIHFLRNLETQVEWFPGRRAHIEARTVDSLFESEALDHTLFLEAAIRSDFEDTTVNVGLGYRYLVPDSDWMLGVNAFYDREFPIGHERMSLGLEASTSDFTLFANRYMALSGWTERTTNIEERPLSGWDVGIAGQVPRLEDLRVSLSAFRWEQDTENDKTGLKLTADYDVSPALQLGATISADDSGDVQGGLRLTYQLGADHFGGIGAQSGSVNARRLAFVNRENIIRTETRDVPNDYTVQFLESDVNTSNQASLAFELAGAPRSASYSYTITSSGGGTPVAGSGRVEGDPQPSGSIDVSGLADGTLTLTLSVTSKQGAVGRPVTAQIAKATSAVSVTTEVATPGPINVIPIQFRIAFSRAVSGFDLSDVVVTNGTASNLQTADNITWTVDITPDGQGAVALQVPAAAATGGDNPTAASNPTTVIFDSEPPSGYGVSFMASPITAAVFALSAAEVGATFTYTITSSNGGTPVTGNGTVSSPQQQVTGLDLSGLVDGTLTLSLTLSDPLGNLGTPVTDTMAKDSSAPVIVAITPPATGTFDEL